MYRHFVATGRLSRGDVNAFLFEFVLLGYVTLPTVVGNIIGRGQKNKWRWALRLVGEAPEPRAWDYLWRLQQRGIVQIKLKSGRWLAGLYDNNRFNRRSYASGYPETGGLYLAVQLKINPVTGEFINENGSTRPVAIIGHPGLLVRWEEIEYLNFQEY